MRDNPGLSHLCIHPDCKIRAMTPQPGWGVMAGSLTVHHLPYR